jgi:hypothetical protein
MTVLVLITVMVIIICLLFLFAKKKHPKKIAVVTAIFGDYDNLKTPPPDCELHDKVDWFCFTDNPSMSSSHWKIIHTPYHLNNSLQEYKDNVHKNMMNAKYYKIMMHRIPLLQNYDYYIWIDGSVSLRPTFLTNIFPLLSSNHNRLIHFQHSVRNSVRDELEASMSMQKYKDQPLREQYDQYRKEGFPDTMGLFENTVFVRKNDTLVNKMMEMWWMHNLNYSYQDQISYPFVLWKTGMRPYVIRENVFDNEQYTFVDKRLCTNHRWY